MPVDWNNTATWQRLVSSIVITLDNKINLKEVAHYYGTTYNTLENRFRIIRKEAQTLKDEVDGARRSEPIEERNPKTKDVVSNKTKDTKKHTLSLVASGRVTKRRAAQKTQAAKRVRANEEVNDEEHSNVKVEGDNSDEDVNFGMNGALFGSAGSF